MIAIVPARGGSKGLPGKNIKMLGGKPLIAHTILAAQSASLISDVFVSTDEQEIYDIGLAYGAKKSFLRPQKLATDDSLAIDNYLYTVKRLNDEFGYNISSFVVLQPTSPLRAPEDIDNAINLFVSKRAESVISFTAEAHPVQWHKYINNENKLENIFPDTIENRQSIRQSFYPNGAVYVFSLKLLESRQYFSRNSFATKMPRGRSVDIDTIEDFELAEFLLRKRK